MKCCADKRWQVLDVKVKKVKELPLRAWTDPKGSRRLMLPNFKTISVWRLSSLHTGRFYPSENIPCTRFCYSLSQRQGRSAAGRIMAMKNCNENIGNRARDLAVCSAVPQLTAPPAACPLMLQNVGRTYLHWALKGWTNIYCPLFRFCLVMLMESAAGDVVPKTNIARRWVVCETDERRTINCRNSLWWCILSALRIFLNVLRKTMEMVCRYYATVFRISRNRWASSRGPPDVSVNHYWSADLSGHGSESSEGSVTKCSVAQGPSWGRVGLNGVVFRSTAEVRSAEKLGNVAAALLKYIASFSWQKKYLKNVFILLQPSQPLFVFIVSFLCPVIDISS